MTDAESLLLVVAVVYLAECLSWARRDALGFAAPLGKRFRARHPGALFGNERGGFLVGNPFPPLGALLVCEPWPLSLSPDGVYAYVAASLHPEGRPAQEEIWLGWEELGELRADGRKLLAGGRTLARVSSARHARGLALLLRDLRALPRERRASAIEEALERSLDEAAVAARLEAWRSGARRLHVLSNALFATVFVLAPALAWAAGLAATWRILVIGLVVALVATLLAYARAHRLLHPDERGERRGAIVLMLLQPLSAIRAHEALGRDLLASFHPLAAARALLVPEDLRELAGRALRDLVHPALPVCPSAKEAPCAAEAWFRSRLRQGVERWIERAGIDREALLAPPVREGESSTYCPRCLAQFTLAGAACAACGGLALFSFPEAVVPR